MLLADSMRLDRGKPGLASGGGSGRPASGADVEVCSRVVPRADGRPGGPSLPRSFHGANLKNDKQALPCDGKLSLSRGTLMVSKVENGVDVGRTKPFGHLRYNHTRW